MYYQVSTPSVVQKISKEKEGALVATLHLKWIVLLPKILDWEPFVICLLGTLISLITMDVGINVEGGIFRKKLVKKCNKRGVEGGNI